MEKYYKNNTIQTKEQADQKLAEMDAFVTGGPGKAKPLLDVQLTKIWNNGDRLSWEFYEETQQEIDIKEAQDQSALDKIEAYKSDLKLFLDEKVRPWRDRVMVAWFDSIRSKPELWEEQDQGVKDEALLMRQTLKEWPATFTKYVTDQTIEGKKPVKPSYIKE